MAVLGERKYPLRPKSEQFRRIKKSPTFSRNTESCKDATSTTGETKARRCVMIIAGEDSSKAFNTSVAHIPDGYLPKGYTVSFI